MKLLGHCYLLVLFLFLAGRGPAWAQSFAWARLVRGPVDTATVRLQASATDAAGNTYVAVANKAVVTGPSNFLMQSLLKYSAIGTLLWTRDLAYVQVIKMAADNSTGGVFLTASTYGTGPPSWAGVPVPINSGSSFYAKCSAAGTLQWSNPLPTGSVFGSRSTVVVADNAGNAYFSGTVGVNSTLGTTPVSSADNYVFATNGVGAMQWVQVLHTNAILPLSITLGSKPGGGCLLGGVINNTPLYSGTGTALPLLPGRTFSDGFLTSFDAAGTLQWTQLLGTAGSAVRGFVNPVALAADASGNCYVTGQSSSTVQMGGNTLPTGFFLAKYNALGTLQWVQGEQTSGSAAGRYLVVGNTGPTVELVAPTAPLAAIGAISLRGGCSFVHFNEQGVAQWATADAWPTAGAPSFFVAGLGIDAQDNLYPVGQPSDPFNNFAVVLLGTQTTVGKGVIVSRLNAYANTLRGRVYFDQNGNGQQDAAEGVFPRQLTGALTQGSTTIFSTVDSDGALQVYANPGSYSLGIASVPAHYTLTQPTNGTYTGTFSGNNQLIFGQRFGIAPVVNQADVRVTITPYERARPGFTTRYRLTVENVGTTTASGIATVTLDNRMAYVSSTPSGTVAGQVVTWPPYTNLAPFGRLEYDILFSLPTNTVLGTALLTTATAPLAGDVVPADNTATLPQTVVGAFDPNSIEVNYGRLTPAQVAARQPLDYTIHFQNLGTAAASHVILSDTLDFQKLDPASLMLVAQSHNCIWSLTSTGPNIGLLTVRFLNINLPERNVDVIRSQGFVRFRVQPRPTLALGEVIPNRAGIVFDFNDPVITNTATTTVFLATAALARHEAAAWTAYPNPATDAVTLATDLTTAGPVRIELLDVLGRPVRQQILTAPAGPLRQTLDLRGLAAGTYVLRLTPPTGPATSRRVVRE